MEADGSNATKGAARRFIEEMRPILLRSALEMMVAHRVQTKEDIERSINLNPEDIESLSGTKSGWLTAQKIVAFPPKLIMR
jgi:hypothetical protein